MSLFRTLLQPHVLCYLGILERNYVEAVCEKVKCHFWDNTAAACVMSLEYTGKKPYRSSV